MTEERKRGKRGKGRGERGEGRGERGEKMRATSALLT